MNFNLCCRLLFLLMVTTPCQGFDFRMDPRELLIKNQTYCGLLQCKVDTFSDTHMASLIKMDIYYLKSEQLLATMLAENSDIQAHTGNNTKVIGSMSSGHGEFHVYFSDVANCSQTAFVCKIQIKNSTNGKEIAEKYTIPINSDQRKSDIYVKTQISFEHKIFDKPETNIKKLNSHTSMMNEETWLSFEVGDPGQMNYDYISMQIKKCQKIIGRNAEQNNFEQKLFDFEVKIRTQLEFFMRQMSSKIDDMTLIKKEIKTNLNEVKEQEMLTKKGQSNSALAQCHNDSKLLSLERRMDDIIDTIKEILKNDRQMNNTMIEIQRDVNNITKLLKEGEKLGEIQQSLNLLHKKLNDSKLLNEEVTMGEVVSEMQNMNLTLLDLKKSVHYECNGDVIKNKTDQRLSSLVEHLEELKINQGSLETLLVNVTGSLNVCNASASNQREVKCERGITYLLASRVITSLENQKQVLCDTVTDGGGWIIILRRANGQVNFTRNWNDYKNGFGSLDGEFWIGNDLISTITSKGIYTLRIDMRHGSNAYSAEYDSFMVKNESDNYRLHLGVFSGNVKDAMSYHNNMAFSTPDRDSDGWVGFNCALYYKSGWWYNSCLHSNLNGVWGLNTTWAGLCWDDHSGLKYLDFVEMKIRLK